MSKWYKFFSFMRVFLCPHKWLYYKKTIGIRRCARCGCKEQYLASTITFLTYDDAPVDRVYLIQNGHVLVSVKNIGVNSED